jgi:hypothetical protein
MTTRNQRKPRKCEANPVFTPEDKQRADWLNDPSVPDSEKDAYLESQIAPLRAKRLASAERRAASERVEIREYATSPGVSGLGQRRRLRHNGGVS